MAADSRDWLMRRLNQQEQYADTSDVSDLTGAPSFYHGATDGYAVHSLDDECCPAVVDKATFLGTLAFIAAGATYLVTLLLTNAVLNGLNLQNLLQQLQNALNLNGLVNMLTNAVTNGIQQVTNAVQQIQALIPGIGRRRSLPFFSPAFMAGTDTFSQTRRVV